MKEQEKLKATVLRLYSAGSKVADIVTQTDVPRSTVYYWIKNEIPKETSPLNSRDYYFLKQKCERQEKIIAILKSAPCAATAPSAHFDHSVSLFKGEKGRPETRPNLP